MIQEESLSPMMQRYLQTKAEYKDCILFYRLGDFYEMFFDDAKVASKELELTLTSKACGLKEKAPMCGVPFHSASGPIEKLVEKGYKVAICEQMEDPKLAKGLVEREVVRVITPGTLSDDNMLDEKKNNYLAICYRGNGWAVAFCDISTGEVFCANAETQSGVINELARYMPSEILLNEDCMDIADIASNRLFCPCEIMDDDYFREQGEVIKHFGNVAKSLDNDANSAVVAMLKYLIHTQKNNVKFINKLTYYKISDYMEIDFSSRRSLEICATMRDNSKSGSLLGVLDKTKTSMGARRLKQWVEKPLIDIDEIEKRQGGVLELTENMMMREEIAHALEGVYDISRILTRVMLKSVTPRDMVSLRESLVRLPEIQYILHNAKSPILQEMYQKIDLMEEISAVLTAAISDNPPNAVKDGGVIASGFSSELDELRSILSGGKEYLMAQEEAERERTGIKNLRVSYNKIFGYYIEVTKSNIENVPENYIRKQTLTNAERYITPELKEFEEKVLTASEKVIRLEAELYEQIRSKIDAEQDRLKADCEILACLDSLYSLAEVAVKNNYTKPIVTNDGEITIKQGRHPVVEKLRRETVFVPNDTILDSNDNRLLMITGPNMAGKSTYMRQNALIVLMAQIGSFVPCEYAKISITDKIFTRVGASDDIGQGQSTFMLEMSEVSNILHNATAKSLIILDEIGRGTSTFDGLSIAWAVAEFVADKKKIGAKTLFATHYHELCSLEGTTEGVKNYSVAVKKRGDEITFLRKIVPGGTDDSFGIEVAALAGVPKEVVRRAKTILAEIESGTIQTQAPKKPELDMQLGFGDAVAEEIRQELAKIDATTYTPIEALNILHKLSTKAKEF